MHWRNLIEPRDVELVLPLIGPKRRPETVSGKAKPPSRTGIERSNVIPTTRFSISEERGPLSFWKTGIERSRTWNELQNLPTDDQKSWRKLCFTMPVASQLGPITGDES